VTGKSLSFDRVSDLYDRTRALPQRSAAAVTQLLLGELSRRAPVLEIGIGTGRIGLPLLRAGLDLCGIDISFLMLQRLRIKPGGATLPVAMADATRLPFRENRFGHAFACHVLHLITDWRQAVAELVRVVAPGGSVLVEPGGQDRTETAVITQRFLDEIGGRRPGLGEFSELDRTFAEMGASLRELPRIEVQQRTTFGQTIDDLESGLWSATWNAREEQRSAAAARLRPWVEHSLGALHEEREITWEICWRAYDLP
jgi:ubiquinone/menaquinone biosynthesis C-methylase UbiE